MTAPDVDFEALRRLSVPARLQLIGDLWDTVAEEAPDEVLPLVPELAAELDRRVAYHEANPESSVPWDQLRDRLRGTRP